MRRTTRILVIVIPVLQCPSCGQTFPDLEVLTTVEVVLERHVSLGDARRVYLFSDLASEVFVALGETQGCAL